MKNGKLEMAYGLPINLAGTCHSPLVANRRRFGWAPLVAGTATLALAIPLRADTIYQVNSQGKQEVVQRDAIVLKYDPNYVNYKHFDLKERRVVEVGLNKGSLPFQIVKSPEGERRQIVDIWKRFGYTATVTDLAGKSAQVFDAYLDFYPPGGRGSLMEDVPPRTTLPLTVGDVPDEIDFSKIDRIEFQGQQLKLTLRDGRTAVGTFLMPTNQPAEARIMGITDHYDPSSPDVFDFSLPLSRVKLIQFGEE
jgi:hypothetical protein